MYDCPGDKRWHRLTPREFQNRNADAQLPSISRNAGPDKVTANKNIQPSPDITNADAKEDIWIIAAPRKSTNIQESRTRQGDLKKEYANDSDITNADAKAPTKPTKAHPYDCSRDKRGHCQASHYIQTRQVDHKQEHTTKKNSRRAIAKIQRHQHNRNKCR